MQPIPKMMPGQTEYTPKELEFLYNLIGDAAEEDPGEDNERTAFSAEEIK